MMALTIKVTWVQMSCCDRGAVSDKVWFTQQLHSHSHVVCAAGEWNTTGSYRVTGWSANCRSKVHTATITAARGDFMTGRSS